MTEMLYFSVSMSENNDYSISERTADRFETAHLFHNITISVIFPHVKTFSCKGASSVGDVFHSFFLVIIVVLPPELIIARSFASYLKVMNIFMTHYCEF